MTPNFVSVVMPVFNGEEFLKEAIESLLNQTYKNFELLVLNDGSTDSSSQIIRSFDDSRIRYLENTENKGLIFTRNRLFDEAKGDLIAILDCDDWAYPTRLEKQVEFLNSHNDHLMVGSWVNLIDNNSLHKGAWHLEHRSEFITSKLLFTNQFAQSSVMLRKSITNLKYDVEIPLAEDYELWTRISSQGKVGNVPEALTKYRVHQGSISIQKQEKLKECVSRILERQIETLGIRPSQEDLKIHKEIAAHNFTQNNQNTFKAMNKWLEKLLHRNEEKKIYDPEIFSIVLGEYFGELLSANIDLKAAKVAFQHSTLSDYLSPKKKKALHNSFRLRSFPFSIAYSLIRKK